MSDDEADPVYSTISQYCCDRCGQPMHWAWMRLGWRNSAGKLKGVSRIRVVTCLVCVDLRTAPETFQDCRLAGYEQGINDERKRQLPRLIQEAAHENFIGYCCGIVYGFGVGLSGQHLWLSISLAAVASLASWRFAARRSARLKRLC